MSIFNDAITLWGEEAQLDMAIEECSELIKAICKRKRGAAGAEGRVMEEAADVAIMIKQLLSMFGTETYRKSYRAKVRRLKQLIKYLRREPITGEIC